MIAFPGDLQRVAGDGRPQVGMVAINRTGDNQRALAMRKFERPWSVELLRMLPASTEVLLTARESSLNGLDLYRFDTLTGARTLLSFESPGYVRRWVVDFDGVARAAVTDDVDHDVSAWYVRRGSGDAWTKVEEAKLGRLDSHPLQFDPDGKLPANSPPKRLPLVVNIHGGPHVPANVWGYDREVQFFASCGYAVLQPQFRGTRGFGLKHLTSGYREWGLAMQDDLEDGARWAVEEGIADAKRVCYYGGSYGGFAAIVGTIRSAGIVRCAVAVAAATSIDYLFDSNATDVARLADRSTLMQSQIGDPRTDRARWKSINPLDNADKVSAPILLAYGIADACVPLAHGNDFCSALDRFHKPYEWVTYGGEGHGFNSDENVFDFYRHVDQFLAKHLNENASGLPSAASAVPSAVSGTPGN